jgi:hypothetical protein
LASLHSEARQSKIEEIAGRAPAPVVMVDKNAVLALWREHLEARFPDGWAGSEVDGVDLVMLDADAAGCIGAFVASRGARLDEPRIRVLRRCLGELQWVVDSLDGEARLYFERLRILSSEVLAQLGR